MRDRYRWNKIKQEERKKMKREIEEKKRSEEKAAEIVDASFSFSLRFSFTLNEIWIYSLIITTTTLIQIQINHI